MDLGRRAYKSWMRFDATKPDRLVRVRWYFCDDNAQVFPYPHHYLKSIWDTDNPYQNESLGELGDGHSWDRGDRPDGCDGSHFCGPLDAFMNGVDFTNGPLGVFREDGVLACCSDLDPMGLGFGVVDGNNQRAEGIGFGCYSAVEIVGTSGLGLGDLVRGDVGLQFGAAIAGAAGFGLCDHAPGQGLGLGDQAAGGEGFGLGDQLAGGEGIGCDITDSAEIIGSAGLGLGDQLAGGEGLGLGDQLAGGEGLGLGDQVAGGEGLGLGDQLAGGEGLGLGVTMAAGEGYGLGCSG